MNTTEIEETGSQRHVTVQSPSFAFTRAFDAPLPFPADTSTCLRHVRKIVDGLQGNPDVMQRIETLLLGDQFSGCISAVVSATEAALTAVTMVQNGDVAEVRATSGERLPLPVGEATSGGRLPLPVGESTSDGRLHFQWKRQTSGGRLHFRWESPLPMGDFTSSGRDKLPVGDFTSGGRLHFRWETSTSGGGNYFRSNVRESNVALNACATCCAPYRRCVALVICRAVTWRRIP